jgi:hypothetical protein
MLSLILQPSHYISRYSRVQTRPAQKYSRTTLDGSKRGDAGSDTVRGDSVSTGPVDVACRFASRCFLNHSSKACNLGRDWNVTSNRTRHTYRFHIQVAFERRFLCLRQRRSEGWLNGTNRNLVYSHATDLGLVERGLGIPSPMVQTWLIWWLIVIQGLSQQQYEDQDHIRFWHHGFSPTSPHRRS